ncbi:MAG: hypothetical protein IPK96_07765 [Flammeovirgaceae bacterium]|nr:hypothetical protein [Flammeovirgaceae bacterium]
MAEALKNDFPDLISTQFHFQEDALMTIDERKEQRTNIMFADPSFLRSLISRCYQVTQEKDLTDPGKVFLTGGVCKNFLKRY